MCFRVSHVDISNYWQTAAAGCFPNVTSDTVNILVHIRCRFSCNNDARIRISEFDVTLNISVAPEGISRFEIRVKFLN